VIALGALAWGLVMGAHAGRVRAGPEALRGPRPLPDMRVDVNGAAAPQLGLLPGIGPALAGRIVTERGARGAFESLDDLGRVEGIGPATIERLREYAVVDGEGTEGLRD
jgi:competence protein ComEA